MDREKIKEIAEMENWRQKRMAAAGIFLVSLAVFAGAFMFDSPGGIEVPEKPNSSPSGPEADSNGSSDSVELTDYQKSYVECPEKYLPLCTDMSKLPTEPVKFQEVDGKQLYLELPRSDRTLVAQIKDGGKSGYLIRIEE